jgi:hypothetical protein
MEGMNGALFEFQSLFLIREKKYIGGEGKGSFWFPLSAQRRGRGGTTEPRHVGFGSSTWRTRGSRGRERMNRLNPWVEDPWMENQGIRFNQQRVWQMENQGIM